MFRSRNTVSAARNPNALARLQSQASGDVEWADAIKRIMALTARYPEAFASQPFANRISAILEAVVPSRKNPTHEKVLSIVNALVETGAIRPDEGGQVYNALLERVSRYNSMNVQTSIDRLSQDVRNVVAQKERMVGENMGSMVALNAFLSTLPANVERGQENYTAFISALRLLVSEVPQTEVYQSGPNYYLQTSRNGSHTVNLTRAFENLSSLWGVNAPVAERSAISSILTPNTRLLLLLIAPFTDGVNISRASYIGYLLTLYRETIGQAHIDERTYNEITSVSRAVGNEDAANLQATLNFLLTNRQYRIPKEYSLTPEEERILRFVQQSVSLHMMQDGSTPSAALDETSRNFEPSFYAGNRLFINKLMDYFHRAAAVAPNYFMNAVLNPKWLPPEGFFTGVFDFPEGDDGFVWDDTDVSEVGARGAVPALVAKKEGGDDSDLSITIPSIPRQLRRASVVSDTSDMSRGRVRSRSRVRRPVDIDIGRWLEDKNTNATRASAAINNEMENLVDKMTRWRTYAQEQMEEVRARSPIKIEQDDDDWRNDRFLKFEGSGAVNLFSHLKPKGMV
ncbi:pIIIa [Bovine mastadenovirus A]|uniref:pIIIa n=1 Tax=Bovine mastadenovirus A TaxID=129953 RepID=UPI0000443F8E|nr:pIIIa [Bovine mastadenovirus A]